MRLSLSQVTAMALIGLGSVLIAHTLFGDLIFTTFLF